MNSPKFTLQICMELNLFYRQEIVRNKKENFGIPPRICREEQKILLNFGKRTKKDLCSHNLVGSDRKLSRRIVRSISHSYHQWSPIEPIYIGFWSTRSYVENWYGAYISYIFNMIYYRCHTNFLRGNAQTKTLYIQALWVTTSYRYSLSKGQ